MRGSYVPAKVAGAGARIAPKAPPAFGTGFSVSAGAAPTITIAPVGVTVTADQNTWKADSTNRRASDA